MPENTAVIDTKYRNNRQARIKQEEEELAKLLKGEDEGTDKEEVDGEITEETASEKEDKQKVSKEEETYKKRYGDLRRHAQKKEQDLKDEIERLKNQGASVTPPTSEEDLEKWQKDNPEIASIISTLAEKKANERFSSANERLKHLDEEASSLKRERAENEIAKKHPDFYEIREDDAFHDWAETQPKVIQDALYEDPEDYQSVIRVLDLYKADVTPKPKSKKAKEDIDAAASVSTKGKSTPDGEQKAKWSESKVYGLSDADYAKYAEEIDQAMADGNFIYDMQ